MKFGQFMMPLHPPGRSPNETYYEDLELVRRTDIGSASPKSGSAST